MRASTRSAVSRRMSTPCRNSSSSVLLTRSRLSSCRYSAMFSPGCTARLPHPRPRLSRANCDNASRSEIADETRQFLFHVRDGPAANNSRYRFATSASPRIAPALRAFCRSRRRGAPGQLQSSPEDQGDPAMIALTCSEAADSANGQRHERKPPAGHAGADREHALDVQPQ